MWRRGYPLHLPPCVEMVPLLPQERMPVHVSWYQVTLSCRGGDHSSDVSSTSAAHTGFLTKEQMQRLHLSLLFLHLPALPEGQLPKRVALWEHSYLLVIGKHPQNLTQVHFLAPTSLHTSIHTASSSHCHAKSLQ